MTNIGGELIQISLGPAANAITSHLCNLQGLSCTLPTTNTAATDSSYNIDTSSSSISIDPLCDPYVTHAVQNEIYVPRVLFVDGKNCFDSWPASNLMRDGGTNIAESAGYKNYSSSSPSAAVDEEGRERFQKSGRRSNEAEVAALGGSYCWRGKVQVHHRMAASEAATFVRSGSSSHNSNDDQSQQQQHTDIMNAAQDGEDSLKYYADTSYCPYWNASLRPEQRHAFENFQRTAYVLSSNSSQPRNSYGNNAGANTFSRYHSSHYRHVSSQFVRHGNQRMKDNGRVMIWDDDADEEDNDDYDNDHWNSHENSQRKLEEKRRRQEKYEASMHHDLANYWNEFLGTEMHATSQSASSVSVTRTAPPVGGTATAATGLGGEVQGDRQDNDKGATCEPEMDRYCALSILQWMQYFMPPHPYKHMYSAPLPFDRDCYNYSRLDMQSSHDQKLENQSEMLYSYYSGSHPAASTSFCSTKEMSMGITTDWRENVLSDKMRKWMEDCDTVKGFQLLLDGDQAFFGGVAASVLEELSDECRSANKFSVVVQGGDEFHVGGKATRTNASNSNSSEKELATYWRSENKVVNAFRKDLNRGLLLHGVTANSDLVLPLSLPQCWSSLQKMQSSKNIFEASAAAAIALETATLPFRMARGAPKTRSKIGMASGYFQGSSTMEEDDMFPSIDRLTFHEYISSIKPSNRHILAEMSCLTYPMSPGKLHQSLLQGTSIERRQLEQERNRFRSAQYIRTRGRDVDPGIWMEDSMNGGILTSISPIDTEFSSRSLHHHFALASSCRALPSKVGDIVSTYTTSFMEGQMIRYRTRSSLASVATQSFSELTDPNTAYSAGSYWNHIFGSDLTRTLQPLSVMGNSTRVHGHLKCTGNALKAALSQKYKGYLSRDNMAGLAPEIEDCEEAKESCLSLRDLYEPPLSGYQSEEEGVYFEDNCD